MQNLQHTDTHTHTVFLAATSVVPRGEGEGRGGRREFGGKLTKVSWIKRHERFEFVMWPQIGIQEILVCPIVRCRGIVQPDDAPVLVADAVQIAIRRHGTIIPDNNS